MTRTDRRRFPVLFAAIAALLALFGALALPPTARAQQEPVDLTSNTSVSIGNNPADYFAIAANSDLAIGVRTGDDQGGYALTGFRYHFAYAPTVDVVLSLWTAHRFGTSTQRPDNRMFVFDNPSSITAGFNNFTVPQPFYMHDDWVYFIVAEAGSSNTSYDISNSTSDIQSGIDSSDWSIFDNSLRWTGTGAWPDDVQSTCMATERTDGNGEGGMDMTE